MVMILCVYKWSEILVSVCVQVRLNVYKWSLCTSDPFLCVQVIPLPVHTVPTYGREACERKAMNQWNSNLEVIHSLSNITIQAPLLEICQEIALKLHCEKAERMYRGPFATRHTFSRKKGQQLCESVNWKQPARTDVRASGRLHFGKGFFKTLDELSNDIQNAIACRWM